MGPGLHELTLRAADSDYGVRVLVPSRAPEGDRPPAVLVFHGGGGTGPDLAEHNGFEALAEAEGFIVAHPTADPSWPLWEIEHGNRPGRDDLAFANQLIDTLIDDGNADPARIYSVGASIGGTFSARLAAEIPERLAGVGSVAQIAVAPKLADPPLPMPLIQINGTADPVIPFDGNGQTVAGGAPDSWMWMLHQNIPEVFADGAARRGCTVEPEVSRIGDDVVGYRYPCGGGVDMVRYEIIGGGHVWPGSTGPAAENEPAQGFSATTVMWEFLRHHTR